MTTATKTPVKTWQHGKWTLTATPGEHGIAIEAFAFGPMGSRHGRYSFTAEHGLLTVSMASVKVNEHLATAKVTAMLKDLLSP